MCDRFARDNRENVFRGKVINKKVSKEHIFPVSSYCTGTLYNSSEETLGKLLF